MMMMIGGVKQQRRRQPVHLYVGVSDSPTGKSSFSFHLKMA
jgi:hypothetical protein